MTSGGRSAQKANQAERVAASGAGSSPMGRSAGLSASRRPQHPLNEVPEVHDFEELLQIARDHGRLVAYAGPSREWTFAQLCDDVERLTGSLRDEFPAGAADALQASGAADGATLRDSPWANGSQSVELQAGTLFRLRVQSPYLFCVAFLAVVRAGGVAVLGEGGLGCGATAIPLDDKDVERLIHTGPGAHACAAIPPPGGRWARMPPARSPSARAPPRWPRAWSSLSATS